ncbi:hypothetical protein DFH28DRAFT_1102619 [Melampsora americana]|nr:hypothetical protein DFH28DRAFT_1102619 [Melampsora americana]
MHIQTTLLFTFLLVLLTSSVISSSSETPKEKTLIGISSRSRKPLARCPTISNDEKSTFIPNRQISSKQIPLSYILNQNHQGFQNKPSLRSSNTNSNFEIELINQRSDLLRLLWDINGENFDSDRRGIHQDSIRLTRQPERITTHLLGIPLIIRGFSSKKLKLAIA